MSRRLILDTHILVRWLYEPKKLSREQFHAIEDIERQGGSVAVSAYSLIEFVLLAEGPKLRAELNELLDQCETNPLIELIPFTTNVAQEMAAIGQALRDPGVRVIVATARVHGMRLLTADQRIIDSRLVSVIE